MIRVGAPTNAELAELQHRVEDALSATRAAMAEGIVAGGGVALLHAASALDDMDVKDDHAIGVEIVRRALTEPTYLIADERRVLRITTSSARSRTWASTTGSTPSRDASAT